MSLKRKTRNLPNLNDTEKLNQLSFFDPVYPNEDDDENDDDESSVNSLSRQTSRDNNQDESNETLDADPVANSAARDDDDEPFDQDESLEMSTAKITARIKQIQNSVQQAQTMLDSMERFKHLVPGSEEQCEKLRIIIDNLEEQQAGYVNLLNLITLTNEERSALMDRISTSDHQIPANIDDQSNDDEEEEDNKPSIQRKVQFPIRPRIESKIGLTPTTPAILPIMNISDNEQNTRNDNSNYDSLVGSLKSDTINWKDQQSTSEDEASDVESDKEMERNLMLQKEQLRALQGQKRALLALKKRSEERLVEQQQLINKKTAIAEEDPSENNLLSDINTLRDRLQLLRNLYEQKHEVEVQQVKNSSKKPVQFDENRSTNLHHVREQLDELEQIVTYYQSDLMNQQEEETTVYEEAQIQPDDVQHLRTLMMQQKQESPPAKTNQSSNSGKPLDKLSNELAAKRLELEQAKSALSRLQQMVKKIEPAECSSSVRSTPIPSSSMKPTKTTNNQNTLSTMPKNKTSLLSNILSPKSADKQNSILTTNTYADAKMAAQHREIERLVESRQRLHTLKDQIATLHQSMTTPPIQSKKDSNNATQVSKQLMKKSYENQLTTLKNQEEEDDLELYRFECESGDGEEIDDDDDDDEEIQPRIKQGNFHAPEDIVAEHEQRLLNKKSDQTDQLSTQISEIGRCLSTFIQEQKLFNRHIEEHLSTASNPSSRPSLPSISNSGDVLFNQLQQQVLTQGLIVNLNTAYREIAVLQSEINGLQSENNRLTSSLSSHDNQHQYEAQLNSRNNSKEPVYSLNQNKPTRSKFNEHMQQLNHNLITNNHRFENSSKTSLSSQSTGNRTAINLETIRMETTPIKHERNATFIADRLSSPKPIHLHTKQLPDEYEITSNHHRISSKGVPSKSFIIRRRPISNDNENQLLKSQSSSYNQQLQQNTFDDDDDDDDDVEEEEEEENDDEDSDNEQRKNDLSRTIFNIQPSAYYSSSTQDLDNTDIQTLNLQVKSIMVQLIPFMRLHINEIFNHSVLNHIRERILFLFKQQLDSAQLVDHFQNQFSESLGKAIEKYCGTTIRDCAVDLIRDISDVAFDELIKYKVFENNTANNQTVNVNEPMTQSVDEQQNDDTNLYDSSVQYYRQETSLVDDGENENKYQIELAESESRPLTLVGSDEEDNEPDQEENKDSDLETAVSRQDTSSAHNETTSSGEVNSNGHEYVIVHRSTSDDTVDKSVPDNEEKKNENEDVAQS